MSTEQTPPHDRRPADRSAALDALFWRDEILQVMFWMHGEGLAEAVGASDLRVFVNGDHATLAGHLEMLVGEGLLEPTGEEAAGDRRYVLSDDGRREAGRRFADAFEGMQKQGHGECSPDCICNWEGPAACPAHQHPHQHG